MTPRRGPSELQPKFTAFSRCSAVRDFVAPLKRDRFAIIAVFAPVKLQRSPFPPLGNDHFEFTARFSQPPSVRKTGVFRTLNAWQLKGCVCAVIAAAPLGGFSEQASMTVDMGKFSVLATFRQLIPCFRSVMASSRRKTRLGRPRRVPRGLGGAYPGTNALPNNPSLHLGEGGEQVHQELRHRAIRASVD